MNKEEIDATKPIAAMICLAVVSSIALILGINGLIFAGAVAAIAGLGGYTLGHKTSA